MGFCFLFLYTFVRKGVSMNVQNHITRLSRYKSVLVRMHAIGIARVHADTLAEAIGSTPAQVRKDFSIFGIRGQKRGGYRIHDLIEKIREILGLDQTVPVILAGYGNLGKALSLHPGFQKGKIRIAAAFDPLAETPISNTAVPVYPPKKMDEYIPKNGIRHAILAVPDTVAQDVFDHLYQLGIRGFMSFSSIPLRIPEDAFVNQVDLESELETVIFYTKNRENNGKKASAPAS